MITILSNAARSSLYTTNFFGLSVDDTHNLGPLSSLGLMPAFFLVGLVVALLLLLVGRLFKVGRRELFRYLAGLAFAMGLICAIASCLNVDHFGLSLAAVLLGLALFFGWAVLRSISSTKGGEFRGYPSTVGATYLVLLAAICFFEFQPFMIAQMFDVADANTTQSGGIIGGVAIKWVQSLAAITAPVAAAVTLFRQQFADLLKGAGASDLGSRLLAHAAKAAVLVAGLALPLLIWVGYLYLCYWGIANDKTLDAAYRQYPMIEEWGAAGVQPVPPAAGVDVKEMSSLTRRPASSRPKSPIAKRRSSSPSRWGRSRTFPHGCFPLRHCSPRTNSLGRSTSSATVSAGG
ncbi:hypothetical protein [Bradyrhizobium lupini]|uniref:hypothetical protein n=1 Tax=Rhizobium lupini TaxID=136996 RepID=UPI0034C643A0